MGWAVCNIYSRVGVQLMEFPILTTNIIHNDNRGFLVKPYCKSFYSEELGIEFNVEESLSTFSHKNVIRGMHYSFCSKIVSVSYGEIEDVIVCIDKNSRYFGNYYSFILNDQSLFIGKNYAHGFKVLSDFAIVSYLLDSAYDSKNDHGIHYNSFGYNWHTDNPIMSEKDFNLPKLSEI